MGKKTKSGGGARKYGRNRKWCEGYRSRGQRELNKALKIERHLKAHPFDKQSKRALGAL